MIKCEFCGKEFSKYGIKNHIRGSHTEKSEDFESSKRSRTAWNKGLTKETSEIIKEAGKKLSEKFKSGEMVPSGFCSPSYLEYMKTDEYKIKQSEIMKRVVSENPDSYDKKNISGRVKLYDLEFFGEKMTFKGDMGSGGCGIFIF